MKKRHSKILRYGLLLLLVILAYEVGMVYLGRRWRRRKIYRLAALKSKQISKPLLVIGDPYADNYSISSADYGCGDVCLDINGSSCPVARRYDLNNGMKDFKSNSFVIFISCTLEYVDDVSKVYAELKRVSGGDLFVVNMEPYTLKTLFFPNLGYSFKRKWRITECPPYSQEFTYYPIL